MDKQHGNRVANAQGRASGEHTPRRTQSNNLKNIKLENPWSRWHTRILVLKTTSIHYRLATEMNKCIQKTDIPEGITKGKTTLIQKDPLRSTATNNYRPITCLPMIWKILTTHIREKIFYSLIHCGIFPKEQKRYRKRTRGTGELLYID